MIGCRPLTDAELDILRTHPTLSTRDRTLLIVGATTGFRISELLSLRLQDITSKHVKVERRNMKGQHSSRTVLLHPEAKAAIEALQYELNLEPHHYLFRSREGDNQPLSRSQAYRALTAAFKELGLEGKVATHSLRKYFANGIYEGSGKDIVVTQRALGHKSVASTGHYLSFRESEIEAAILKLRR